MRKFFIGVIFSWISFASFSQSSNAPLNGDYYHLLERYEVLSGEFSNTFHTAVKPYEREDIGQFVDKMIEDSLFLSKRDRFNLGYLSNDNWDYSKYDTSESKKPFLKWFYRKKPDFGHLEYDDFVFHINPVINFTGGLENSSDILVSNNTRGLEFRGRINNKLAFYSYAVTTQAVNPTYVRDWIKRYEYVPGEGFWKKYNENGVDYFTARGYISFDVVKYVNVQFGHGKFYKGLGQRSLIMSDFSNNKFFLKLNTRFWRINYSNIFAELKADHFSNPTGSVQGPYPFKFLATHHISFNITKDFNVGLYETVISGDSTQRGVDLDYFNPMIFYRALEHNSGSPDNIMVGFDARLNLFKRITLYGQLMLDEFHIKELTDGNGWWANKFGGQALIKYFEAFGIPNLDLHMEYNFARPHMYQHSDVYTNYAHYKMPVAHPLGANFKEVIGTLRYQPAPKWNIVAQLAVQKYGTDSVDTQNVGKEVMKSYLNHQEYGNFTGQGLNNTLIYGDLVLTFQPKHNLFLDLKAVYRDLKSDDVTLNANTMYISGSFRWNIPRTVHDF